MGSSCFLFSRDPLCLLPPTKGLSFRKPQALAPWHSQPHPTPALKVRVRSGAREGPHPLPACPPRPRLEPRCPTLAGAVMYNHRCCQVQPSHALGGGCLPEGGAQGYRFHVQTQPRRRPPGTAPTTHLAVGWRTQTYRPTCRPRWPMAPGCSWRASRRACCGGPGCGISTAAPAVAKSSGKVPTWPESPATSKRSWRAPPAQPAAPPKSGA